MVEDDPTADRTPRDVLLGSLLGRLREFVASPLTPGSHVLRGLLPPTEKDRGPRVVLWDGQDLGSTYALEIPLLDEDGEEIPHDNFIAALRACINQREALGPPFPDEVFPVPVLDARRHFLNTVDAPPLTLADALYLPLLSLGSENDPAPFSEDAEEGAGEVEWRLLGFMLVDERYARYYVRWTETGDVWGLDFCMRDDAGEVDSRGGTADMIFPALASSHDLERFHRPVSDNRCQAVFDLTTWC
ncbi:hypothetical protein SSOG_04938 [Streptomyces himastatinicus ATCC 53653]|uniref:Uncharacterized protein n=1 Tax=Streptomyces himastatinicus ATCC 53653 TaxID=457427 RepID=D9WEK9_9ACTN|nr:hypothetical protein [Streptomyces himastatinicus]EFL25224.1 hypothetical protein SSOG_04938 [Streptomyces himastatinicus ATCC 53653]